MKRKNPPRYIVVMVQNKVVLFMACGVCAELKTLYWCFVVVGHRGKCGGHKEGVFTLSR